jgi:hypothetical protein
MHIDSYRFGRLVVDGSTYTSDCLIFPQTVRNNWRRKEGHRLSVEDLEEVFAMSPDVLVIGCGADGVMQVPDEVCRALEEKGVRPEVLDTTAAVKRFNELCETGANVAAALHLTC